MSTDQFPIAVRLAGFPPEQAAALADVLKAAPARGPSYICLSADSLQEPDVWIAYGPDLKAMAALAALAESPGGRDLRPALVIGMPGVALPDMTIPYPSLPLQYDADSVHAELALLVARRADALMRMAVAGQAPVAERRRSERLDFDLTDPAEYEAMRNPVRRGAVLVVDGGGRFHQRVAALLKPYRIAVLAADCDAAALAACNSGQVAVVLINAPLAGGDPYALCAALRTHCSAQPPAVVVLAAPLFDYDSTRARAAGAEGMLDKPVTDATLMDVLKRLMPIG